MPSNNIALDQSLQNMAGTYIIPGVLSEQSQEEHSPMRKDSEDRVFSRSNHPGSLVASPDKAEGCGEEWVAVAAKDVVSNLAIRKKKSALEVMAEDCLLKNTLKPQH